MAIDWVSRHLYFTNTDQSPPGLDGTVHDWHRVEKISLEKHYSDGYSRWTVTSDVTRPNSLSLDLANGWVVVDRSLVEASMCC